MRKTADRLNGIGEYYFSQKLREIETLNQAGKNVLNLGIGSPDLPPDPSVVMALQTTAADPQAHAYQSYKGIPALRQAMAKWYQQFYGVILDPEKEVLPLMGSKEGILHLCMTYLNPGDQVLVPNPGYPTYASAVKLAGAEPVFYALEESNQWLPNWAALSELDLSKVKMMWVNYPQMPTGQLPPTGVFEQLIAFGQSNNILVCHDNPYSFIGNPDPSSIFSVPGALDTAVELNSLSKSHNMAGWRVGMLMGSATVVQQVLTFKSNMDSGMFLPVQKAAIAALNLGPEWYRSLNETYAMRRQKAEELLRQLGCEPAPGQAGLFSWAKIPSDATDAFAFSDHWLHAVGVFITPGGIFGSAGNRFIRVSLCSPLSKMEEAIQRIKTQVQIT
ncbi:MAG: aminotransferase class I/II-fold pyridoxal phosphate-dependent enzyme [Sphingobacteriia bacterium]|nr:MAG: aminotransferase class I/II-fold pyridoxal phosphate-dependent enzyme [Sphingobacteriia bacterium]